MKFKKLLIFLLVFCSVFMISIPVNAEEPTETYPCYCERCVSAFNSIYSTYPLSSYDNVHISGFNESLNGYYLFIIYNNNYKSDAIYFCKDFKLDTNSTYNSLNKLTLYNYFGISLSSRSFDLSSFSLSTLNSEWTLSLNGYKIIYAPTSESLLATYFMRTYFDWPSHPISEAEKFSNNFPSFITTCWNSLTDFIGDNNLVLFVFAISVAFALIGLIKRCTK